MRGRKEKIVSKFTCNFYKKRDNKLLLNFNMSQPESQRLPDGYEDFSERTHIKIF
jgi:hypothetical protein